MIAQYLTWDDEEDRAYGYTYEIKGTKDQEEFAEWLWVATKDLSDAIFGDEEIEDTLDDYGYGKDEIKKIFEVYPDLVSEDPFTAYDECVLKLKEMGMEIIELDDCDEPDVLISTGIY